MIFINFEHFFSFHKKILMNDILNKIETQMFYKTKKKPDRYKYEKSWYRKQSKELQDRTRTNYATSEDLYREYIESSSSFVSRGTKVFTGRCYNCIISIQGLIAWEKSVGDDIRIGKKCLSSILSMQKACNETRERRKKIIGKNDRALWRNSFVERLKVSATLVLTRRKRSSPLPQRTTPVLGMLKNVLKT